MNALTPQTSGRAGSGGGPRPRPAAPRRPLDARTRKAAFEAVWECVHRHHFDPRFGGVDWRAVRVRYAPQVEKAGSDAAFYALLERMVGELRLSHFAILTPDDYAVSDVSAGEGGGGASGTTGITVGIAEKEAIVQRVAADSPAHAAGVRPGDRLDRIEDRPVADLLQKLAKSGAAATAGRPAALATLLLRLGVQSALRGPVGKPLRLTITGEDGKARRLTLARAKGPARREALPGFPPMTVEIESRRLENGLGYVRFSPFTVLLLDDLRKAVRDLADAPGLILDLRGNPGGLAPVTYAVAGLLTDRPGSLGVMKTRQTALKFLVTPQPPRYRGKVAVLTDEFSLSCSEILAGGLQEMGRAVVVGRPTGGMVLPSTLLSLPGGARLQFAYADFITPKGVRLEGRGVRPDHPVALTRASLYAAAKDGSDDPDILAAIRALGVG